jgi:hypothetical protein
LPGVGELSCFIEVYKYEKTRAVLDADNYGCCSVCAGPVYILARRFEADAPAHCHDNAVKHRTASDWKSAAGIDAAANRVAETNSGSRDRTNPGEQGCNRSDCALSGNRKNTRSHNRSGTTLENATGADRADFASPIFARRAAYAFVAICFDYDHFFNFVIHALDRFCDDRGSRYSRVQSSLCDFA